MVSVGIVMRSRRVMGPPDDWWGNIMMLLDNDRSTVSWLRLLQIDRRRILDANRDYVAGKGPVTYIQNHDHSTAIHDAGGRGRWFKTQPAAVALLTSRGAVMIHNGQEFEEDKFLSGSGDGRVVPRPLQWSTQSPERRMAIRADVLFSCGNSAPSLAVPFRRIGRGTTKSRFRTGGTSRSAIAPGAEQIVGPRKDGSVVHSGIDMVLQMVVAKKTEHRAAALKPIRLDAVKRPMHTCPQKQTCEKSKRVAARPNLDCPLETLGQG